MSHKILVVDDDRAFIGLVEKALVRNGYQLIKAGSGRECLQLLFDLKPDLVLLEIDIPGVDGWQTCRRIRDFCDTPVIITSGIHDTENDIVRGLNYGADDYIIKPVGESELLARVQAVLRRASQSSSPDEAVYNDDLLNVNLAERRVVVNDKEVRLTAKEFKLFALLVQNANRIVTYKMLLEKVWGWEYTDDLDYVRIYIWHLRHKIELEPAHPRYIITEPGVGYRFRKARTAVYS